MAIENIHSTQLHEEVEEMEIDPPLLETVSTEQHREHKDKVIAVTVRQEQVGERVLTKLDYWVLTVSK